MGPRQWIAATLAMLSFTGVVLWSQLPDDPPTASPAASQPSPATTPAFDRSAEFPVHVELTVQGAATFTWEGEHMLTVNDIGYPDTAIRMLSAGLAVTVPRPDEPAERFRWSFDLFNRYLGQPDVFTFHADEAGGMRNTATFVHLKVTEQVKSQFQVHDPDQVVFLKHFTVMARPCTVEVGPRIETGELRCPRLTTDSGEEHVSYTVRWSRTAERASGSARRASGR